MITAPTLIAIIVFLATVLWVHVIAVLAEWIALLRRADHGSKISVVIDMLGALVPVVILFIAVVFASSIFGFRSSVVFLAVIVPGGLVFALRSQVTKDEFAWSEGKRWLISGILLALVLGWRAL